MSGTGLQKRLSKDIKAVEAALLERGLSGDDVKKFIADCEMTECLKVLDAITSKSFKISKSRAYQLKLVIALCSLRDKRRIFYWLNKNNVRTKKKLNEMADVYRIKFEDRCPKVLNFELKKQGTRRLLVQANKN